MDNFWLRKAYAPEWVPKKLKVQTHRRGRFVIKTSGDLELMETIWNQVKRQTRAGLLGYFSTHSDNRMVIIVYHSSAMNTSQSQRIANRLIAMCKHTQLSISHRMGNNSTLVFNGYHNQYDHYEQLEYKQSDDHYQQESSEQSSDESYEHDSSDDSSEESSDDSSEESSEESSEDESEQLSIRQIKVIFEVTKNNKRKKSSKSGPSIKKRKRVIIEDDDDWCWGSHIMVNIFSLYLFLFVLNCYYYNYYFEIIKFIIYIIKIKIV